MDWLDRIGREKIIAIVRGMDESHIVELAGALREGGIRMVEVTFNQKMPESWAHTCRAISAIARAEGDAMCVGAGTVLSREQLRAARDAGAAFMVSPNVDAGVIGEAKRLGMGAFPGAFTASEVVAAHDAGADAVKVFPAGVAGPGYIRALKAPLSHIALLAVGGVDEKNAADFLRAGAVGVGVGGNLVNRRWVEDGEFHRIAALAAEYRRAVDLCGPEK